MSFWNHFGFQPSPIDSLLEKPDVTIEQLMDEPDLIQECKSQNRKLIEFCVQKSELEKIINYVVEVPAEDADEKRKVKYPELCTDVLCAEVWQFSDAVYGNIELLKKLYSFFEMNPDTMTEAQAKVANNCAKCITSLLHRKSAETLKFLRGYPDIAARFVDHVCNPSILDYILRLIGDDDPHGMIDDSLSDGQLINEDASTVSWLCEQKFIDLLIDKFVSCNKEDTQQSIGLMLFELASNLSSESAIISRLESVEMVDKMFTFITNPDTITNHRSVSLCGFSTLIELLRKQRVPSYQDETDPQKLPTLVVAVSSHLADCKEFLINAPRMPKMETTFGTLDPPLGLARQSVLELVESLALTNSAYVFKCLFESRFMETAIDLFFKYPWNNFAHQSVFNIIATVLPQPYHELSDHIVRECKLLDRILEAEEENKKYYARTNAALGYIGHLTKISSLINSLAERERPDGLFASEVELHKAPWDEYCSGVLKIRNEKEAVNLGGTRSGESDMYSMNEPWHEEDSDDSDGDVVIGEDPEEAEDVEEEEDVEEAEDVEADDTFDDEAYDDEDEIGIIQRKPDEEEEPKLDDEDDEVVVKEVPEEIVDTPKKEEITSEEKLLTEEEEKKEEATPAVETPAEEEKKEEAPAEEKKEEETPAVETPAEEEKKEAEAPVEEKKDEAPVEEKKEEAPAEEKKEEAPAESQ